MTVISNETDINRSTADVYAFLEDCTNHEQLMPENIYNWSATRDEARFTIQNMAKLALQVRERIPHRAIHIAPLEKPPFDVTLRWELESTGETSCRARLVIEADLNMMMKMLAVGPLQKLVDHQVKQLTEVFSQSQ